MAVQKNNSTPGLAIASLVLGLLFFFPIFSVVFGVAAIVCGVLAIKKIKRENLGGKRLAIAGIVLGVLGILSPVLIFRVLINAVNNPSGLLKGQNTQLTKQVLSHDAAYLELYKKNNGKYPDNLEDVQSTDSAIFPSDPFQNKLYYKVGSDGQSYELRSLGPDKQYGTSDDILP